MPTAEIADKRRLFDLFSTLRVNVQRFRGGLVFKAHRLLYHSRLENNKEEEGESEIADKRRLFDLFSTLWVRIPGRMPGACVRHASVPVFPCHVQPL